MALRREGCLPVPGAAVGCHLLLKCCFRSRVAILQGVGECIATLSVPKVRRQDWVHLGRADGGLASLHWPACMAVTSHYTCSSGCPASTHTMQIFLLNGAIDRETSCCGPEGGPMAASDMVQAAAGTQGWEWSGLVRTAASLQRDLLHEVV